MERRRVTLAQRCTCGAAGRITFQESIEAGPADPVPRLEILDVEADGCFIIATEGAIVCRSCGANWH
jgi:hypothetical protein